MTPTSVTRGKIVPFGDHLRADEDVDLARAHAVEHGLGFAHLTRRRDRAARRAPGKSSATAASSFSVPSPSSASVGRLHSGQRLRERPSKSRSSGSERPRARGGT